jgi:hypothetical protein
MRHRIYESGYLVMVHCDERHWLLRNGSDHMADDTGFQQMDDEAVALACAARPAW